MGKLYVVDKNGKATKKMSPFIIVNGELREIDEIYFGYNNKAVLIYPTKSYLKHFTVNTNATDFVVSLPPSDSDATYLEHFTLNNIDSFDVILEW